MNLKKKKNMRFMVITFSYLIRMQAFRRNIKMKVGENKLDVEHNELDILRYVYDIYFYSV